METRTVGVEEELLLVDPETATVRPVSRQVLASHRDRVGAAADEGDDLGADSGIGHELFLEQLETATEPHRTADGLRADLLDCRRAAGVSAEAAGVALAAVGTSPMAASGEQVTRKPRYERIVDDFGEIGRQGSVCGMHVHVAVDDDNEGVRVIDGLRPWLPVLRAMSVNSPYSHGHDTGYASWRSQVWGRWPTAGPSEPFVDPDGYRASVEAMIASGAALDTGMLYLDARLATRYPTVEVRVFDTLTELDDVVLLALLTRALVSTIAGGSTRAVPESQPWRVDLLRAAHWRASRDGLSTELLDPRTGARRPARAVVEELVATVAPALEDTGDLGRVRGSVETLIARGTGAARQRAAYERSGGDLKAVVTDLRERFAASYR